MGLEHTALLMVLQPAIVAIVRIVTAHLMISYVSYSKLSAPDDAIIITEVGYSNLQYLSAYCIIITTKDTANIQLTDYALDKACKMLGNPAWQTQLDY